MPFPSSSATVRDVYGGVIDAFTALAIVLTLGLLAFSPLGASAAGVGIPSAMAGVVAGGVVFALVATSVAPAAGPTSATTLILAGLVATLVQDPLLQAGESGGVSALLAVTGFAVLLMGVFQIGLMVAGVHRLARRVPQPVLAGFMNGIALLILLAQLPPLLGLPPVSQWSALRDSGPVQPLAAVIGALTVAVAWTCVRWRPHWPAPLLALLAGTAAYWVASLLLPAGGFGPVVGALRESYAWPDALAPFGQSAARELLARHAPAVISTALAMAVISSLESLLTSVAVDQVARTRHDSRRDLLALGLSNVASGLVGGLPVVYTRARAIGLIDRGLRHRATPIAAAGIFAMLQALGTGLIGLLPKAALAGIMVLVALALVDRWTRQLIRRVRAGDRSAELKISLAVVVGVCATTLFVGFTAAIFAGTLLSLLLFMRGLNRSLVRSSRTAAEVPSRRVFGVAQEAVLAPLRSRIRVLELEGALFFGSSERLAEEVDAMPAGLRVLILDLRRLTTIDESGAVLIEQVAFRLPSRGVRLLLAGVGDGSAHRERLLRFGTFGAEALHDWHADADRAIEAAERLLLAEAGVPEVGAACSLEDSQLAQGLAPTDRERLARAMRPRRLQSGEVLFQEGDPGDCLYVLTRGSISIVGAGGHRYVSFSPSMVFGETAMLDGRGRSAGAVADADAEVQVLTRADFDRLQVEAPALAAQLLRNLALNLADRLRVASVAWQASAR